MHLLAPDQTLSGERLTGGVSSDIWRIDVANGPICVKRALGRLRVEAEWRAPVSRNLYEARWMRRANAAVPGAAPALLGQDEETGTLAMAYLSPADHPLWKDQLRDGFADAAFAARVGGRLARIHAVSAADPSTAAAFPTDEIFRAIRLEPYLIATARNHPDRADALQVLVATTQAHKRALVHGDISPKNILAGPAGPVFLDAECAWWGDPAFDLAFCLNHLLLKCCLEAGGAGRVPVLLRRAGDDVPVGRRLGTAGRGGNACRTFAARPAACAGGWEVAGGIHHRGAGQGSRARMWAGAAAGACRSAGSRARGVGEELT